jgi:nucleotide-binding universal stress UspA family protein
MPYRHVLTVYDGRHQSEEVLDMVCRIVRPHRARLTILYAKLVPLTEPLPEYKPGADAETDALVARAERIAEDRGVVAAYAVRYARTMGAAVVTEARVRGVDLVALAMPEAGQHDSGHRVEIHHILDHLHCAIMLCRPSR